MVQSTAHAPFAANIGISRRLIVLLLGIDRFIERVNLALKVNAAGWLIVCFSGMTFLPGSNRSLDPARADLHRLRNALMLSRPRVGTGAHTCVLCHAKIVDHHASLERLPIADVSWQIDLFNHTSAPSNAGTGTTSIPMQLQTNVTPLFCVANGLVAISDNDNRRRESSGIEALASSKASSRLVASRGPKSASVSRMSADLAKRWNRNGGVATKNNNARTIFTLRISILTNIRRNELQHLLPSLRRDAFRLVQQVDHRDAIRCPNQLNTS